VGEIYKDLDVAADMKRKKFEWIGHGIKTEEGNGGRSRNVEGKN
jgi:hypothetical protein